MTWNPPDPMDREPKECVAMNSPECPEGCEDAYTSECPLRRPEPLPFDDEPEDDWEEYPDDAPAGYIVPRRRPYEMDEAEVRY